tara:strand:+ start:21 stop:176 length:156 start_codon:yes stop_codon:yes gene_type:complete
MNHDKEWMLITYYCPTHGNSGRIKLLEISRKEISKNFLRNEKLKKKLNASE